MIFLVSAHPPAVRPKFKILLIFAAITLLAAGSTTGRLAAAGEDLRAEPRPGRTSRVQVVLEVKGDLKLNADGQGVTRLPIEARGQLSYDERILELAADPVPRRDVRFYRQAEALVRVAEGSDHPQLDKQRRVIVVATGGGRADFTCPLGPLAREDLELIDVQGNTSLLDRLLPDSAVEVGTEWRHPDPVIGSLLGLEALQLNDVKSTLRAIEDNVALIDLSGSLRGAVGGVSSDIEVRAKYNFDFSQRQVTWLAMTIKENRAIGHAEPGFEVTARLRVRVDALAAAPELDAALAGITLESPDGANLLRFASQPGRFQFLHPAGWRAMVDRHDGVVLRLIDQGDLIAQCNVSSGQQLEPGEHLALERFQADIQRGLGDRFGQFVEASQTTTPRGYRLLRVAVTGLSSELPIRWTYYHLSDDEGRQASFAFVFDENLVERFGEADQVIISSFEFLADGNAPPQAAAPLKTAAKPAPTID